MLVQVNIESGLDDSNRFMTGYAAHPTLCPMDTGNVCVCVCVGGRVKGAEARNSLITYSININSAWAFTFILIYVFGVWCSNKRKKLHFTPSLL